MFELIDTCPETNFAESEYRRLLGFPDDYMLSGHVKELAERARAWYAEHGKPWVFAREIELRIEGATACVGNAKFRSATLLQRLAEAEASRAVVVAVSAGPECEEQAQRLWREEKPDEYFFLEIVGSAVVEHLVTTTGARLCVWAERQGMAVLPHYSPGYTGWEVADQASLFGLLSQGGSNTFPGPLLVRESGMLQPRKSLLALFGVTARLDKLRGFSGKLACESCAFPGCAYRRAPYAGSEPLLEDVRQLQPTPALPAAATPSMKLNSAPRYSFNQKALRKWSRERLRLQRSAGRIEARFRYDGTTCSDLGHPLAFDYLVQLEGRPGAWRIRAATCTPVAGDTGYKRMCAYFRDGDALLDTINGGMPLVGKPLDDVFAWRRVPRPSGCYCEGDARDHKWAMALEVIHYALVELEREPASGI